MNVCICVCAALVVMLGKTTAVSAQQSIVFETKPGEVESRAKELPSLSAPARVKRVAPVWPNGVGAVTGVVTFQLTLEADGRVAKARPLQVFAIGSNGKAVKDRRVADLFLKSASEAVTAWQYEPVGGTPVTFMMSIAMRRPDEGEGPRATREVKVTALDPAVKKIRDVKPWYPPAAQLRGIQGIIFLEGTIDADGRVIDARVLRAIPYLDQPALDAVMQWEFDPQALAAGLEPRAVVAMFTVNFVLR